LKPPRRFRRGGDPSFKDSRALSGGKMEISPRASMVEERRRGAAPAVERKESERLTPDSRGIYMKFSPSGVSGP